MMYVGIVEVVRIQTYIMCCSARYAKFVIFNICCTEVEVIYSKYMLSRRRREDPALVAVPVPHKPSC